MSNEEYKLQPIDLNDKILEVDNMFHEVLGQQNTKPPIPNSNYNNRGQLVLSPKDIRQNYQNAFFGFKWYQIPLCRRSIKRKINFWAPASVALAWTYGEYVKKKDPTNIINSLPMRFYLKSFAFFFTLTSIYCFGQSLLFQEFCQIDSPFYQQTESRLSMARRLKGQISKTKDGGFLTSIFG